jgi:hypothetical protein
MIEIFMIEAFGENGNWEPIENGQCKTEDEAKRLIDDLVSVAGFDADCLRIERYAGDRAEAYGA